jgi:hypothetical protein
VDPCQLPVTNIKKKEGGKDMKRICSWFIAIALVLLISRLAEAQMSALSLGEGWKAFHRMQAGQASPREKLDASIYIGYISGIVDAASYYRSYSSQVTVEEACNAVGKYLDKYPELLHGPAAFLVVEAISQAFPEFPTIKYR